MKRKCWTDKEIELLKKLCADSKISIIDVKGRFPNKTQKAVMSKIYKNRIKFNGIKNYLWSNERKQHRKKNYWKIYDKDTIRKRALENNPMKNPIISAKFKGELNPSKRKEFRCWISKNNPMKNPDVIEKHRIACNNPVRKESIRKRMLLPTNPWRDKKVIEKRTSTYTKRLSEGLYQIKNNWKTGYYIRKNGNKEWYDSSYELERMKYYDECKFTWTKKHKIRIPYVNQKGQNTYYVPDFLVSNNILEEIKGWIKPNDILKSKIGIEFCKFQNWSYRFLLGKDHRLQENLSYEHNS